jgi:hypothetical protein
MAPLIFELAMISVEIENIFLPPCPRFTVRPFYFFTFCEL